MRNSSDTPSDGPKTLLEWAKETVENTRKKIDKVESANKTSEKVSRKPHPIKVTDLQNASANRGKSRKELNGKMEKMQKARAYGAEQEYRNELQGSLNNLKEENKKLKATNKLLKDGAIGLSNEVTALKNKGKKELTKDLAFNITKSALGGPNSKRTKAASTIVKTGIKTKNFVKDISKTSKGFITGLKDTKGLKKNVKTGSKAGAAVGGTTGLAAGVAMGALGGPVTAIGAGTIGTAAGVAAGVMVGVPIGAATNQISNASSAAKTNHKKFSKKAQEKRANFAKRHKTMAGLGIDVRKTNKNGKISSAIRKLKPQGRKR